MLRNILGFIVFSIIVAGAFGSTYFYLNNSEPLDFVQKEQTKNMLSHEMSPAGAPTSKLALLLPPPVTPSIATSSATTTAKSIMLVSKEVLAPGALISSKKLSVSSSSNPLSMDGVLFYTNEARLNNGRLPPL